jgi:hypothetical protein
MENGGRPITLGDAMTLAKQTLANLTPGIEVGPGRLGHSVYATQAFRPGEELFRAWGPYTTLRSRHSVQVDTDLHIITSAPLRFMNHSCAPNCGLLIRSGVEWLEVRALQAIQWADELTLDYNTFESKVEFLDGPCLCGSPSCLGAVRGYEYLPQERREVYGIYVAEYLRAAAEVAQVLLDHGREAGTSLDTERSLG